jgi:DNA polymerase III subunit delta'
MVFRGILGQEPAVATLTRALESGRVHHAYRFEGPDGVGKERAAFALAQSLVCTAGRPVGCGACAACARAVKLTDEEPFVPRHPDVVLVQRGLYPAAVLGTTSRESTGIGVEQIRRVVLARVGYTPHEGRSLVFIVRAAHELTVSAANALLKTLEEPAAYVHFILLTSQPSRLLDTIRSRTLAVRFGPLSDAHVARILEQHGRPTTVAPLAQGSASLALELADDEGLTAREAFIRCALDAVAAPSAAAALDFAGTKPPERDALKTQLGFLAQHLSFAAREQAGRDAAAALLAARRYAVVLRAVDHVDRNAQPALILESMIAEMRAL